MCAHVFLHVHGHGVYTCVCMCVLHVHTACAHTCMHVRARIVFCVYVCVLTSWTLPGSVRVLKPTRPSARRPGAPRSCSSVCSASEFRAVKTLAGSSRKLCLCGNEVPSAPQPSYWLIDDMIPRGSPVIPGNTISCVSPPPSPPPPSSPLGSGFHGATGAPREAAALALAAFSQPAARPLVNVDTAIMCARRLKGPLGIFCCLKVFPFPQPCVQPFGATAVTRSLAESGALEWAHPGPETNEAGTVDLAGARPLAGAGALQTAGRRVRGRAACADGVCACACPVRT